MKLPRLYRVKRVVKRSAMLRNTYYRLFSILHDARIKAAWRGKGNEQERPDPGRIVWIFGSGRSGSTWLRSILGDLDGYRVWEEPMVGRLFGEFYARAPEENRSSPHFIMGDPVRRGWLRSVRSFVLDGARYSRPDLRPEDYLIVKEPNGSVGAPIIMEALPESRMILLVRDPRDVVASVLDAAGEGGWLHEQRESRRAPAAERNPDAFVRSRASVYLRGVGNAKRAYESHEGPKALVRYEDLRADTLGSTRRTLTELGLPFDEAVLARPVEKHSWENVPESEKGAGKVFRKASPGGWREDLTPKQVKIVEEITAPLLREFYPHA